MIEAYQYPDALNPGDLIDEQKIPEPRQEELIEQVERAKMEEPIFDLSELPDVPEPPEEVEPIADWQKYLDDYQYEFRGVSIEQTIRQIQSRNLDSGFDTLERKDLPEIQVSEVNSLLEPTLEQLQQLLEERNLVKRSLHH